MFLKGQRQPQWRPTNEILNLFPSEGPARPRQDHSGIGRLYLGEQDGAFSGPGAAQAWRTAIG
jgi:hypothetical protein